MEKLKLDTARKKTRSETAYTGKSDNVLARTADFGQRRQFRHDKY